MWGRCLPSSVKSCVDSTCGWLGYSCCRAGGDCGYYFDTHSVPLLLKLKQAGPRSFPLCNSNIKIYQLQYTACFLRHAISFRLRLLTIF